ncbi:TlpA family protein disulfide reductase [Halalkalibacillus sediminis]|uniref:TlpA family protein disulfide reductase n=1 Tax=Halalkalibacillus sediminis TaxID=2018042 RepID=A0A2I0QUP8_9BACI|nr:TlpA disulfide reductase family protein [Halalkalibacillus sediminis]PKR78072.1 TlpA family protein disulfide reductase [Halalkalibacillus sediminis]
MQAPLFELPYLDKDKTFHLEDVLGKKIIVLTFWVSWCPDCSRDLPMKEQFYKNMKDDSVEMITINVPGRERDPEEAHAFQEKFLTQPVLQDRGREVYELYEGTSVPTTIVIDRNGEIVGRYGDKDKFVDIVAKISEIL